MDAKPRQVAEKVILEVWRASQGGWIKWEEPYEIPGELPVAVRRRLWKKLCRARYRQIRGHGRKLVKLSPWRSRLIIETNVPRDF